MKTSIRLTFLIYVLVTAWLSACTSAPVPVTPTITPSTKPPTSTPKPTSTLEETSTTEPSSIETIDVSSIPIMVMPLYNSEGLQIDVGNYSQELKTNDFEKLTLLAQEMAQQKETLTPEQMFVLSIRLYDLGDRDASVYWFYEAQFRAILFTKALDPAHIGSMGDPAFELQSAYGAFVNLAGGYINAYAGCDLDKWIKSVKTAKEGNPKPPDLEKIFPSVVFVNRSQWQQINNEVAAGLEDLANQISENREEIKNQREANNLDALFCK